MVRLWQNETQNEVSYITEPVQRGKISQTVSATGEISATNLVDVGAQVSGQIKRMHVKIGDEVKTGDLIAEIDNVTQVNEVNIKKHNWKRIKHNWLPLKSL